MSIAVAPNNMAHQSGHQVLTPAQRLASVNEETWLQVGKVAEMMSDLDRAMAAYESALRHNPYSIPAMNQIATILRAREQFPRAVEYFQSILNLDQNNGETWGSLGHCYLMMDDLQKAYSAYQQALYHLQNPKEPKLWYGIGILYDRYGSLEHAEEAFSQVMRMDATFDKANEIYFRLGIIYKQQHKYSQSLECFNYIISNPPKPLTEVDIWFQIGHVYEQQKEYGKAKDAYERVLRDNPDHAKVLQQLGWLYHQQSSEFADQDLAIQYLTKSLESDGADAQSWYLLGRCYMAQRKYNKAYEAYQQAVYRDGRNPTFWCSIGVLYYQINQYRDALDAYSRAIRLNPYISEVWYDLGTLYESCNNQVSDALDAYSRAAELDPGNPHIKSRLELLRSGQSAGARPNQAGGPHPQDIHPNAYQNAPQGPPQQWNGQQNAGGHNHNPPPPLQQQQQQQQHQHQSQHQHHQQQSQQPQQQQHQAPPSSQQQQQQHQQSHQQQSHHQPQQQQPQHPHPHASAQSQSNRSGPSTPAQPPFRPPEIQSMRPPHSPDRSKQQNGSRSVFAKPETSSHYQPHSHQLQTHQSPYASSHPAQPHNPPGPNTPMGGNNLAPILGRTSPVSEIKSLASRDDGNAPREQASTPVPASHQSSRPLTPVPINRDGDSATLKRPREWEDQSSAPEPKKQDTSGPAAQHSPQNERRPESARATPVRDSMVRDSLPPTPAPVPTPVPRAPSESPNQGNNNNNYNNSNHGSSNSSSSNGPSHEAAADTENANAPSVPAATTSTNGSTPQSVHSEQQKTAGPESETPAAAAAPETERTSATTSVAPENAERKVDLDENYDDEEE